MSTETITLKVSQDMLAALKMGATDLGERIRLLAAISFFQEKQLSLPSMPKSKMIFLAQNS